MSTLNINKRNHALKRQLSFQAHKYLRPLSKSIKSTHSENEQPAPLLNTELNFNDINSIISKIDSIKRQPLQINYKFLLAISIIFLLPLLSKFVAEPWKSDLINLTILMYFMMTIFMAIRVFYREQNKMFPLILRQIKTQLASESKLIHSLTEHQLESLKYVSERLKIDKMSNLGYIELTVGKLSDKGFLVAIIVFITLGIGLYNNLYDSKMVNESIMNLLTHIYVIALGAFIATIILRKHTSKSDLLIWLIKQAINIKSNSNFTETDQKAS